MSKKDKLNQKILEGRNISFEEADKVLIKAGFIADSPQSGSSHITYRKQGKIQVTLVRNRKELKPYQIKMIQEAIQ